VLFSTDKCEIGRNFANKIWNAGRFLLMNKKEILGSAEPHLENLPAEHLDLADRWIVSRLHHAIQRFDRALDDFQINDSTKIVHEFLWHDFCDWYLELVKTRFYGDEPAEVKRIVLTRALWIFDRALRLLHPVMPFITEELWQHLAPRNGASLVRAAFPAADPAWIDEPTENDMEFVQDIINAVRNIRGENNIPPSQDIRVLVRHAEPRRHLIFESYGKYLRKLARVEAIDIVSTTYQPRLAAGAVVQGAEVFVPLEGLVDVNGERKRLEKEIQRMQQMVESIGRKLGNAQFVDRAPQDVVQREREKLRDFQTSLEKLQRNLGMLASS
jgi:valyl-tRNA synthetase